MRFDLAIVGGGPAGLATAIFAVQRGFSCIVLERRALPLDKACGEGIMPPGTALLEEMGVCIPEKVLFHGIRYLDRGIVAEGRFRSRPGWGVRRTVLIEAMTERARELGVEMDYGVSVHDWSLTNTGEVVLQTTRRPVQARYLVGADGLHSRVRRHLGVGGVSERPARYGLRRHFRTTPWSDFVEVYWVEGAEAYVTPVGARQVGVAILWSGGPARFEQLLERFPSLENRLAECEVASRARGAGPFLQKVHCRFRGPVVLVGDAAGYVDALTGEGISLAFVSARALVEALTHGGGLGNYENAYRRLSRNYYGMTELLLHVAKRPALRRRVVYTLARNPFLFDRLLEITIGEKSFSALGWRGVWSLLCGLVTRPPSVSRTPESPSGRSV